MENSPSSGVWHASNDSEMQDLSSPTGHNHPRQQIFGNLQPQQNPGGGSIKTNSEPKIYSLERHGQPTWMLARQENPTWTMTGRLRHIILMCACLVLPLLGITIALLVIIYQNLLPKSNLSNSQQCSGLIVDYGASQLTSLSTWISTIATLLAPAFMALLAYPVAKSMTQRLSTNDSVKKLPSPHQTSLLIDMMSGSLMAVWTSLRYMTLRKRAKLTAIFYVSYVGLVCGTIFGIFTQLADFWLHQATNSILYAVALPTDTESYGRQLSGFCQDYYDTNAASQASCTGVFINGTELNPPCSVSCGEFDFFPTGFDQGFLLANSLPAASSLAVTNKTSNIDIEEMGTIVAILPSNAGSNTTWTANTVGVSTQCQYLFEGCDPQVDPAGARFTCGADVPPVGYNSSGPIPFNTSEAGGTWAYYMETLYPEQSDATSTNKLNNPWTFGLALRMEAVVPDYDIPDDLPTGDNTIFTIVLCNTTTYDVEYSVGVPDGDTASLDSVGPVIIQKLERSNQDVHNTVHGHVRHAKSNAASYITRAMLASVFSTQIDGQVLPRFEEEYGKVALGFSAPSFEDIPATEQNIVPQRVVSCVDPAPLWSLIGIVGAYIALAFILTVLAIMSSTGNNVHSAQSQLSVAGLAAKAFDERGAQYQRPPFSSTEDVSEEQSLKSHQIGNHHRSRVGFKLNETGDWEYTLFAEGPGHSSAHGRYPPQAS